MLGGGLGILPIEPPIVFILFAPEKLGAREEELIGAEFFCSGAGAGAGGGARGALPLKLGGGAGAPGRAKGDTLAMEASLLGATGLPLNPDGGAGLEGLGRPLLGGGGGRVLEREGAGAL